MRTVLPIAAIWLCACPGPATRQERLVPDRCADAKRPAVKYVTMTESFFRHAVLPHSVDVLDILGAESGAFGLAHQEDARDALAPDELATCSALIFYVSGELPLSAEERARLLRFVDEGGGFVAIHASLASFYRWPQWRELVGAWSNGHPWYGRIGVRVDARDHPAARGLPERFELSAEEAYQLRDFSTDGTVLLRLDPSTVDLNAIGVEPKPWGFPLAWTGRRGKGRTFTTALGHGDAWDDPNFRAHLLSGIEWVLP